MHYYYTITGFFLKTSFDTATIVSDYDRF